MADTPLTPVSGALSLVVAYDIAACTTRYRTDAVTAEQLFHAGRCRVWGLWPEGTTAGTITLRDAGAARGQPLVQISGQQTIIRHLCAIGVLQAGKRLNGMEFYNGLSVQLSNTADRVLIGWEAI